MVTLLWILEKKKLKKERENGSDSGLSKMVVLVLDDFKPPFLLTDK